MYCELVQFNFVNRKLIAETNSHSSDIQRVLQLYNLVGSEKTTDTTEWLTDWVGSLKGN